MRIAGKMGFDTVAKVLAEKSPQFKKQLGKTDLGAGKPSDRKLSLKQAQEWKEANAQAIKISQELIKAGVKQKLIQIRAGNGGSANQPQKIASLWPALDIQLGAVGLLTIEWAKVSQALNDLDRLQIAVFVDSLMVEAARAHAGQSKSALWKQAKLSAESSGIAASISRISGYDDIQAGKAHIADFQNGFKEAEALSGERMDPTAYILSFAPIQEAIDQRVLPKTYAKVKGMMNMLTVGIPVQGIWPNIYWGRRDEFSKYLQGKAGRAEDLQDYNAASSLIHSRSFSSKDPVVNAVLEFSKEEAEKVMPKLDQTISHAVEEAQREVDAGK